MSQLALLKTNRNFFIIWLGALVSFLSDRMFQVIVPIWLYEVSQSAQVAAAGSIVQMAAVFLFGFAGGVIVDRVLKRRLLIRANLLAAMMLLPFLLVEGLGSEVWLVLLLVFGITSVMRLIVINRVVMVNTAVPKQELMTANSMMGMLISTMMLIGPVIASYAIWLGGYRGVLAFCFLGFLLVWLTAYRLQIPEAAAEKRGKNFLREFTEGLEVVRKERVLWGSVLYTSSFMISGGIFVALLYIYIDAELGAGETVFALSMTMQGIGNVLGGFLVAWLTRRIPVQWLMFWLMTAMGVLEVAYLYWTEVWLMLAVMPLIGIAMQVATVISTTIYQKHCPQEFIGRAIGFRQMVTSLLTIATTSGSVFLLQLTGVRELLIGGALFLFVSAVLGFCFVREQTTRALA